MKCYVKTRPAWSSMIDESIPAEVIERINHPDFFFVQIGANDGVFYDPIRRWIVEHDWSGLMFEPQTDCVEKLRALYAGNDKIRIANLGIAKEGGKRRLYRHAFGSGCHSLLLRREHCDGDSFDEIDCITFEQAVRIYGIRHIDLLAIDTEGYDLQILDSLDLDTIKPQNIWFEKWVHDFDDMNNQDQPTSLDRNFHIVQRFIDAGYSLTDYGANVMLSR
jgi:FkbM family methyltransferase